MKKRAPVVLSLALILIPEFVIASEAFLIAFSESIPFSMSLSAIT